MLYSVRYPFRPFSAWLMAVGVLLLSASEAVGQGSLAAAVTDATRPTLRAIHVPEGLTLDGRLDEEVYRTNSGAIDFVQQEPKEGAPATEKTEVWVLFDAKYLYVCARMWDSHPERMIANEMRRDASQDIYQNENFSIILDTFHDRRSGVYLMTNILGAMRDAQFVSEKQVNGEWNPVWIPKSRRFEGGWATEVAIPFKSLRYPSQGEQTWGIQLRRVVRWKNEVTFLTRVPAGSGPSGVYRLQDEATLVGLRTPAMGKNLDIKPYASSRLTTDQVARPSFSNDVSGDVGIDVKYGVAQGLVADFTVNTDFAQVEDDLQQVNLTRFGLFFPEKREFFLEGQGIFDFGGQTGGGNNPGAGNLPTMFFSRQIGLVRGQAAPIIGGARLTGKTGPYSVGVVNIQTDDLQPVREPTTNFSVTRLRRDILARSYVGVLATHRSPSGGRENSMFGVDTSLATGLTTINGYYAVTRTPGRGGSAASYAAGYELAGDRYGANVQHITVERNFNPELGFLRRLNFRSNEATLRFSPRPVKNKRHFKPFRKFYYEGNVENVTSTSGRLESRSGSFSFRSDLENGGSFGTTVERSYEYLAVPFRIDPAATIPVGAYSFHRLSGSYTLQPGLRVRGNLSGSIGEFYRGTRSEARYAGRIELSRQLIIEPTLSLNWVNLPWGSFKTNLIQSRATFTLSPRSSLGALVQYNSSAHAVSSNIRFRWEYIPGSDLFVVYTEGRTTLVPDRLAALQNRTFVIKVTRLLRY